MFQSCSGYTKLQSACSAKLCPEAKVEPLTEIANDELEYCGMPVIDGGSSLIKSNE